MNAKWMTYLTSVGITGLFYLRTKEILDFYQKLYPDQVEDIFVGEYVDKDGNRQYQSLWLFSETNIMEAKKFLTEDDFDCAPFRKQIQYWDIKKENYDFSKASTESRMVIKVGFVHNVTFELKASRENCDYLKTIFLKHIFKNVIDSAKPAQQIEGDEA